MIFSQEWDRARNKYRASNVQGGTGPPIPQRPQPWCSNLNQNHYAAQQPPMQYQQPQQYPGAPVLFHGWAVY